MSVLGYMLLSLVNNTRNLSLDKFEEVSRYVHVCAGEREREKGNGNCIRVRFRDEERCVGEFARGPDGEIGAPSLSKEKEMRTKKDEWEHINEMKLKQSNCR